MSATASETMPVGKVSGRAGRRGYPRAVVPVTDRPIVLIGMMGAGKTTVGRALAERLQRRFVDLDEDITEVEGASVVELFDRVGEDGFRDIESRALELMLEDSEPVVVAAGGGVVLRSRNRELLAERARVVWLEAPVDVLVARIGSGEARPLLATDSAPTLERLLDERGPLYLEIADSRVDGSTDVDTAVERICSVLGS